MLLVNDSESCEEALNWHSIWEVNIRVNLQEKKNTKNFKGNCLELSCIKKCHTPPCCSLIACLYTQVNAWIHKSLHTWVYSTKHLFIFESPSGMTSLWYYLGYFLSVTKLTEPQKKLYSGFLWLLFWQLNWYLCAKQKSYCYRKLLVLGNTWRCKRFSVKGHRICLDLMSTMYALYHNRYCHLTVTQ